MTASTDTEGYTLTTEAVLATRRRKRIVSAAVTAVLLALVVWSIDVTVVKDTDWERMGSIANVLEATNRFIGIDFELFPTLLGPAIETLLIACLGTFLGALICIPAAWFGAMNITPFKPITYPFIDHGPVEAIRAVGGGPFQVFLYAVLPQVLPQVIGVVIFEWEINIRRSAILGLVGAGGLGLVFFRQMNTFNHHGVTTVILAILIIIVFGEAISHAIRRRMI
jgi:phosphonate transport system permease protein